MDPIQRPTTMTMSTRSAYDLDLRDVRGQIGARRALEIAAAGGHNVLMIGPRGCGKTMLAVRLPGLLPVADGDTECPFRAPHHTASALAMLGSAGEVAQPGEVSRADGGVLFLDELPQFSRAVLVGLREPLEHGAVTLRRATGAATLPARFQLVAAMEPCPCGECDETQAIRRCTAEQMARYDARVAGTISDPSATRIRSISSSLVRSKLSKKDSMSASRIHLTLPWYTARFSARIASWAPRPGRNPYEHSRKSCSYTASSTSRTASWTILSSTADIPIGRVRPPPLGMCTRRNG